MRNKLSGVILVVFLVSGASRPFFGLITEENLDQERAAIENYLKTAKIVSVEPELSGRTQGWTVELDDGTEKKRGFFKHANRHRPNILPDCYMYEIAAYELDKLLNLNIVPPVIKREIDNVTGSLQIFLEECRPLDEQIKRNLSAPDEILFENAMDEIVIFENLVFDECGDQRDILVHLSDWRLCRVDFSEAFEPKKSLIPDCEIKRCPRSLFQNLNKLDDELLRSAVGNYLNEEEMAALIVRSKLITGHLDQLIEENGEAAVLYDK